MILNKNYLITLFLDEFRIKKNDFLLKFHFVIEF